jgi:mannose-6-phosphate isomerase
MPPLYPLTFEPVLKRYLWGGRRLGTVLGKPIGEGSDYAESWEVADHEHGQSIVAGGPLAGTSLHELMIMRGIELLGRPAERHGGRSLQGISQPRFPLLFKFLDCQRDLSVQVHPNDQAAARLTPPDLGKTEAWVVLDAQPRSRIYAGLKKGIDESKLRRALSDGSVEECLHWFEPRAGDCVFIPAGTVHALGAGLLVAEIQQASDTTYRLYDWGRTGPDGKPRPLHVEQALAAIDFSAAEIEIAKPSPEPKARPAERLVSCDKFVLDRRILQREEPLDEEPLEMGQRFHILSVVEGQLAILSSAGQVHLRRGETALLPACLQEIALRPEARAVALDMYLPG